MQPTNPNKSKPRHLPSFGATATKDSQAKGRSIDTTKGTG